MTDSPTPLPSPTHRLSPTFVEQTRHLLASFQKTYLMHPQIRAIETDLDALLAFGPPEPGVERPARTYLLTGASGGGKSTILKRFRDRNGLVSESLRDRMEVVYAEIPAAATRAGTMRVLLEAIGVRPTSRASEADLTRILIHHLKEMGVRVLILDEAQHLFDRETGRFAYATADWLKSLANSGISVVIAGLPEAARAYALNIQLERRSMGCQELVGFEWDGGGEGSTWLMLLTGIASKMPVQDTAFLLHGDMPHRLHMATEGYLGRLIDFLSLVLMETLLRGEVVIDREILIAVEDRRRDLTRPSWINVFSLVSLEGHQPQPRDDSRKTRLRRGKRELREEDLDRARAA